MKALYAIAGNGQPGASDLEVAQQSDLKVHIDGPFGAPSEDYYSYERVIMMVSTIHLVLLFYMLEAGVILSPPLALV